MQHNQEYYTLPEQKSDFSSQSDEQNDLQRHLHARSRSRCGRVNIKKYRQLLEVMLGKGFIVR